jgi:polysaccharide export outer membrane protein
MRFSFFRATMPRVMPRPAGRPAPAAAAFAAFVLAVLALLASGPAAMAQDGYRLRAGDTLRIEVVEDAGLNRSVLIAPDGRITLPLAGAIAAGGRTVEAVQADVAARLAGSFAAPPTVFVSLERVAEPRPAAGAGTPAKTTVEVYVMGEGAKPGRMDVERGTTLLQAFAQMGGFTRFAATRRIQLRRGAQTFVIDYTAIERGTSTAGATVLQKGDVILVPQRRLFE